MSPRRSRLPRLGTSQRSRGIIPRWRIFCICTCVPYCCCNSHRKPGTDGDSLADVSLRSAVDEDRGAAGFTRQSTPPLQAIEHVRRYRAARLDLDRIKNTSLFDEQIATHNISPDEVEEVAFDDDTWIRKGRTGTRYVLGYAISGRYLFVVYILKSKGIARVVTSVDMDEKTRKMYMRRGK